MQSIVSGYDLRSAPQSSNSVLLMLLCLACSLPTTVDALAIDNEVIGTPQIHCSENAVTFSVRTRNIFRGNIYIKGQFGVPTCRQEYFSNDYNGASFSVRIGECGMRRIRQLQPHGMNYMLVFVTNFHPQFVTKIDRAYNVRCFYAQTDKSVSETLEVSMLNTQTLEQSTMLMPNCEYSVRQGTVNGPRVRYTQVGDQLVHRWECDNPNYGMLVKNCFVNDGAGSSVRVLDARGCPVFTPVIQGNLQYDNSLNLAYVPIWAYKFPDRSQLYFQCQIQICNKRDNECVGVTPPNCPLITKNEFVPGSNINTGVNPNIVSGTFPPNGGLRPGAVNPINPLVGGQVDPIYPTSSAVIGSQLPYAASQHVSGQTYGGHGVAPQIDPNAYRPSPSSNLIQPGGFVPTSGGGTFPSGLQPARPYATRKKDDSRPAPGDSSNNNDNNNNSEEQVEIGDRRTTKAGSTARRVYNKRSADNIELFRWQNEPVEPGFAGTLTVVDPIDPDPDQDETMDVVAEPMFVADPELDIESDDDDSEDYTKFPFSTKRGLLADHSAVCLNQLGLGLILSTFAVMTVALCVSLFYVLSQHQRKQRAKLSLMGTADDCLHSGTGSNYAGSTTAGSIHAPSVSGSLTPVLKPLPGKEHKHNLTSWSFGGEKSSAAPANKTNRFVDT